MKVSCIMPTSGRRHFVPKAIRYFQAQTYEDRELVIFDDGAIDGPVRELIPKEDRRIRYYARQRGSPERSVGELRNICCDLTSGDVIAHWDDDDWSSPERLEEQVRFYAGHPSADIIGYDTMYFYDLSDGAGKGLLWLYGSGIGGYAISSSFMYRRLFWYHHQFRPINVGEDNRFQEAQELEAEGGGKRSIVVATCSGHKPLRMIARIHNQSTAPKPLVGDQWKQVTDPGLVERVKELLA